MWRALGTICIQVNNGKSEAKIKPHAFKFLKGHKGFTIVEAFIAMSILVFCATALFASLYIGFNLVNDIRENIIASSIIQQKIESLRKTFFTGLPSYGEISFSNDSLSRLNNASAKTNVGQYIIDNNNVVIVVVTVTWHSRLNIGKENVKKAATLIAKNGINSI